MAVTQPKDCLTLDQLPTEILFEIFSRVPFSIQQARNINQICRRIYHLLSLKDTNSTLMNRIARMQFTAACGFFRNDVRDLREVEVLRDCHERVSSIFDTIKANMTPEDLDKESENWESTLFAGLIACARLIHVRKELKAYWGDITCKLYRTMPPESRLLLRYACARIARCMQVIFQTADSSTTKLDGGGSGVQFNDMNYFATSACLAPGLVSCLVTVDAASLGTIQDVFEAMTMSPTERAAFTDLAESYSLLRSNGMCQNNSYWRINEAKQVLKNVGRRRWPCSAWVRRRRYCSGWQSICWSAMTSWDHTKRLLDLMGYDSDEDLWKVVVDTLNSELERQQVTKITQLHFPISLELIEALKVLEPLDRDDTTADRDEKSWAISRFDWDHFLNQKILNGSSEIRRDLTPLDEVINRTRQAINETLDKEVDRRREGSEEVMGKKWTAVWKADERVL